MAGHFPEKLRWCLLEQVCQGLSVKSFELSHGLDTMPYENSTLSSGVPRCLKYVPFHSDIMMKTATEPPNMSYI